MEFDEEYFPFSVRLLCPEAAIEHVLGIWKLWETSGLCQETFLQEPCVPATLIFYELVNQEFGLDLLDAASPLQDPATVKQRCLQAGFRDVQVSCKLLHGGLKRLFLLETLPSDSKRPLESGSASLFENSHHNHSSAKQGCVFADACIYI